MKLSKKTIFALVLCLGVFFMAVGYSILMSELKINGSANITSTWNVRISNITEGTKVGDAYNIEKPRFTDDTAKFNVSLVNPGDSMTYEVTIKNDGTLTAILNNMTVTTSGTDAIIYEVSGIKKGDTLVSGATKTLTIVARYNSNVIGDPTQRAKKLSVDLDWVQYTNQSISTPTYTISYSSNGGSGTTSASTCTVGTACTLTTNAFTRSGYQFLGWSTTTSGAPIYGDGEAVTNLAHSGSVTLYAVWGKVTTFAYKGSYETFTAPVTGNYKLEVWGAEGGYRTSATYAGNGGYAAGTISLEQGENLYVYVGGDGNNHQGYNGGGLSGCTVANGCTLTIYGGGGTDIRVGSHSLYARVIVGGGGGSVGASTKTSGIGGGMTGGSITTIGSSGGYFNTDLGCVQATRCGMGGTATAGGLGSTTSGYTSTAGSFGQGGNGFYYGGGYGGAGGGGWYGGSGSIPDSSSDNDRGGGGGSGFAYTNCSATPVEGYLVAEKYCLTDGDLRGGGATMPSTSGSGTIVGKTGDGFARITQLTIK